MPPHVPVTHRPQTATRENAPSGPVHRHTGRSGGDAPNPDASGEVHGISWRSEPGVCGQVVVELEELGVHQRSPFVLGRYHREATGDPRPGAPPRSQPSGHSIGVRCRLAVRTHHDVVRDLGAAQAAATVVGDPILLAAHRHRCPPMGHTEQAAGGEDRRQAARFEREEPQPVGPVGSQHRGAQVRLGELRQTWNRGEQERSRRFDRQRCETDSAGAAALIKHRALGQQGLDDVRLVTPMEDCRPPRRSAADARADWLQL
jgi:hypothetical protein